MWGKGKRLCEEIVRMEMDCSCHVMEKRYSICCEPTFSQQVSNPALLTIHVFANKMF